LLDGHEDFRLLHDQGGGWCCPEKRPQAGMQSFAVVALPQREMVIACLDPVRFHGVEKFRFRVLGARQPPLRPRDHHDPPVPKPQQRFGALAKGRPEVRPGRRDRQAAETAEEPEHGKWLAGEPVVDLPRGRVDDPGVRLGFADHAPHAPQIHAEFHQALPRRDRLVARLEQAVLEIIDVGSVGAAPPPQEHGDPQPRSCRLVTLW
jgi:hypothetical protein